MSFPPRHVEKPVVILGAGLSGLSLADALVARGWPGPLVLVDRRREWSEDRTWCTWLTGAPLTLAPLARTRWWSWTVSRDGDTTTAHTARHPYVHLPARAVYEHLLSRLSRAPQVEIGTGERVLGVDGDPPIVRTATRTLEASLVVDAMGALSPLGPGAPTAVTQRFLGWEVVCERPAFDPGVATLMDFRGVRADGVDFIYRLPFSATHALVEHTSIGTRGPWTAAARRDALRAELDALGLGDGYEIRREEQGVIPMTARRFPLRRGPRVLCAGGAAGAVRPSSGYAFTRIQRHVAALADAIVAGRVDGELPAVGSARRAAMDAAFLAALRVAPDGGRGLFWALAREVDADAFARFMTDAGSAVDDARIAAALALGGARALRGG